MTHSHYSRLDQSKQRLAQAFERLEHVLEQRLAARPDEQEHMTKAMQQIEGLQEENLKIATELQSLKEVHQDLKHTAMEVFAQLDDAVQQIEQMMEHQHADS